MAEESIWWYAPRCTERQEDKSNRLEVIGDAATRVQKSCFKTVDGA